MIRALKKLQSRRMLQQTLQQMQASGDPPETASLAARVRRFAGVSADTRATAHIGISGAVHMIVHQTHRLTRTKRLAAPIPQFLKSCTLLPPRAVSSASPSAAEPIHYASLAYYCRLTSLLLASSHRAFA
eukprot:4531861-Pleurochrysis_carterae.AAC.1